MSKLHTYVGVYDFELVPYALGDVLTWNVQTAIRCQEADRSKVDIYICVDPRYPASIYQRGLVTADNSFLFFNELLGAFATHPLLSNIFVYTSRDEMLDQLRRVAEGDPVNTEVLADYETVLGKRDDEKALNQYFLKYIYSHANMNRFAEERGGIPLLGTSRGCESDVEGLMTHLLAGKRTVVIHPRLRRLDAGYGGHHTYSRDSDFLEWYEFARQTQTAHPEVQFVVVGRLQEKPLELLRLANVTNLRVLGLGLGHELTLMRRADLFIGTSSGFAAMANFSEVPYFVTHMNKESCNAYAIPEGSHRLPFAAPNQELIYERESVPMLTSLLERGLALPPRGKPLTSPQRPNGADASGFERMQHQLLVASASTSRFFVDDDYADRETTHLLQPRLQQITEAVEKDMPLARQLADRISANFPRLARSRPELNALAQGEKPETQKPDLAEQITTKGRAALLSINGRILPKALHGTIVHRVLKRMKDKVVGYERR